VKTAVDRTYIDRFLQHLGIERRLSPHTATNYARDLRALADFMERANLPDWGKIDSQHVRVFAARAHAGGLSPRSVQRRLSAVRGFFNYLLRERIVTSNPALEIRAPKAAKRLPGTLDVDQLNQLLDIPAEDALSVRDKAIMELFYSSGLRLDELVGLDMGHLDLADRTVRVLGKGRKTRVVPVGRKAVEALRAWQRERATLAASATELAGRLKRITDRPVLVGVGVSNAEQAREACAVADGVVQGASVVRRLMEHGPDAVGAYVAEVRAAIDERP